MEDTSFQLIIALTLKLPVDPPEQQKKWSLNVQAVGRSLKAWNPEMAIPKSINHKYKQNKYLNPIKEYFKYKTSLETHCSLSANTGFKLQVDAHGEKFLAQQLGPIGHINPNNVVSWLTDPAIGTPYLPSTGQWSLDNVGDIVAFVADMHLGGVAESKEALMQVGWCTMC